MISKSWNISFGKKKYNFTIPLLTVVDDETHFIYGFPLFETIKDVIGSLIAIQMSIQLVSYYSIKRVYCINASKALTPVQIVI